MAPWSFFLYTLSAFSNIQFGTGTVFGSAAWDHNNPNDQNACYKRAPGVHEHIGDDRMSIAHLTLPCGSYALLYSPRTNRWAKVRVVDRGPYGRSVVDMTRAVAKKLKHNGDEPVLIVPIPKEVP